LIFRPLAPAVICEGAVSGRSNHLSLAGHCGNCFASLRNDGEGRVAYAPPTRKFGGPRAAHRPPHRPSGRARRPGCQKSGPARSKGPWAPKSFPTMGADPRLNHDPWREGPAAGRPPALGKRGIGARDAGAFELGARGAVISSRWRIANDGRTRLPLLCPA